MSMEYGAINSEAGEGEGGRCRYLWYGDVCVYLVIMHFVRDLLFISVVFASWRGAQVMVFNF
jgi:hypothetical protein